MNFRTQALVLSLLAIPGLFFCAGTEFAHSKTISVTSSETDMPPVIFVESAKVSHTQASSSPIDLSVPAALQRARLSVTDTSSAPLTTDFIIQVTDLEKAGFGNVERVLPVKGRFDEPVRYFRVAQSIDKKQASADCDDCGNLAAVYVTRAMPTSTPLWVVRANPLVMPMAGRWQLQWFAANRIISVIAPGGERMIRALGAQLRERAILGKIK